MSKALELVKGSAQAAPPVAVAANSLWFGLPLNSWASLAAIVYTLLIILTHIRKQWVPWLVSKPWTRGQWWK